MAKQKRATKTHLDTLFFELGRQEGSSRSNLARVELDYRVGQEKSTKEDHGSGQDLLTASQLGDQSVGTHQSLNLVSMELNKRFLVSYREHG